MGQAVFIVDDDAQVLHALSRLLQAAGYDARPYCSPSQFLAEHDDTVSGCAVIDLAMPGVDGLQLQGALAAAGRPVVFLSGTADVSAGVEAMKAGAVDFLTKPVEADQLLDAVGAACTQDQAMRQARSERQAIDARVAGLSPREREVLQYVLAGLLNKQIAARIGIAEKTVKVHRGRMMGKLKVRGVASLVRVAGLAGIASASTQERMAR